MPSVPLHRQGAEERDLRNAQSSDIGFPYVARDACAIESRNDGNEESNADELEPGGRSAHEESLARLLAELCYTGHMPFTRTGKAWPLELHLALLVLFAAFMVCLWMVPVVLMGYPFLVSSIVPEAREFMATGIVPESSSRLSTLIVAAGSKFIAWDSVIAWTALSAVGLALSLIPLWLSIRKLLDVRVAWVSTAVFACMPMTWILALRLDGYAFAYFFLFLGFAFFLYLFPKYRFSALALSGIGIGAALAARDAFLGLLPWFCFGYLWQERGRWFKAAVELAVFLVFAYAAYVAPLLTGALQPQMTAAERVQVFLPSLAHQKPRTGHLYPDKYSFEFLRPEFDALIAKRAENASFLVRQQDENYRGIFGVGTVTTLDRIINSFWLFFNALPEYFSTEIIGGAMLWIFIALGATTLKKKRPALLIEIVGLWLSMEVILRFILRFHRSHLMDISWGITLLAGVGIVVFVEKFRTRRIAPVIAMVILAIAVQSMQVTRKELADLYRRSDTLKVFAAADALRALPEHAVVAHPKRSDLFTLVDRDRVSIHPDTIDYLSQSGQISEPFHHYNVDYIIGYSEVHTRKIVGAVPGIKVVPLPDIVSVPSSSPFVRYLLHIIR